MKEPVATTTTNGYNLPTAEVFEALGIELPDERTAWFSLEARSDRGITRVTIRVEQKPQEYVDDYDRKHAS